MMTSLVFPAQLLKCAICFILTIHCSFILKILVNLPSSPLSSSSSTSCSFSWSMKVIIRLEKGRAVTSSKSESNHRDTFSPLYASDRLKNPTQNVFLFVLLKLSILDVLLGVIGYVWSAGDIDSIVCRALKTDSFQLWICFVFSALIANRNRRNKHKRTRVLLKITLSFIHTFKNEKCKW